MARNRGDALKAKTTDEKNSDGLLFETLVDELIKEKPDPKKVKTLCGKLGIHYVHNQNLQIQDLILNGSKVYLKSSNPKLELTDGQNL